MAKISNKEVYESKAVSGASYVLRRITEPLRLELREQLAPLTQEVRDLAEEQEGLPADAAESKARSLKIDKAIGDIQALQIDPLWLKWAVIKVTDYEVELEDDSVVQVTPDNLRAVTPKAFYDEVLNKIKERASLGGAEIKNS